MPDICMCHGDCCHLKDTCYRHIARPTPLRQAWFMTPPIVDDECEHYWPVERRVKQPIDDPVI